MQYRQIVGISEPDAVSIPSFHRSYRSYRLFQKERMVRYDIEENIGPTDEEQTGIYLHDLLFLPTAFFLNHTD